VSVTDAAVAAELAQRAESIVRQGHGKLLARLRAAFSDGSASDYGVPLTRSEVMAVLQDLADTGLSASMPAGPQSLIDKVAAKLLADFGKKLEL